MEWIALIISHLTLLTVAQQPDEYANNVAAGQCSYTFQVPAEHVNAQCGASDSGRILQGIQEDNARITQENRELRSEIDTIKEVLFIVFVSVGSYLFETYMFLRQLNCPYWTQKFDTVCFVVHQ